MAKKARSKRQNRRFDDFPADEFMESAESYQSKRAPKRTPLSAKNEAQGQYIASIVSHDVTFGIGPAGTGKTFVAASLAAEMLDRGEIDELIITRPMVACDEEMGFLPGEQAEKYAPWVEPVMDVLEKKLGKATIGYMLKVGRIKARPLMLMRGASLERSVVILDEAQNTTPQQMKMFLTRIGEGSKMIINGDENQSDLKDGRGVMLQNGLTDSLQRIGRLPEIGVVEFSHDDIVRHGLVRKILGCYE